MSFFTNYSDLTCLIFLLIFVIILWEFLLTQLLTYLNNRAMSEKLPKEARGIYDAKKYSESYNYEKTKYNFWLISSLVSFFIILIALWTGAFGILDTFLRGFTQQPILLWLLFFAVLWLVQTILSLPLSYYSTFVIEEKFGFNKMTKSLFFIDMLKWLALSALLWWPLLALVIWFYSFLGESFWLYVWALMTVISLFFMMFYSSLIVPIFNKQTPLEKWRLRSAIQKFADKVGFTLDDIYVIDGSKRSSKANAYFSGLGPKKRIVLYDTLIHDLTIDELVAVLAHEIGHYKRKHTLQMLAVSTALTGFMLYILSLALSIKEVSFALWASQASFHVAITAFWILFTPISIIQWLVTNILSRKNEYEADAYARENFSARHLWNALKKLSRNNLTNLTPHPAYEFFYYSHPTVIKRLARLK